VVAWSGKAWRAALNVDGHRARAVRSATFRALGRLTPTVAVDCGDVRYLVSTADGWIGREVFVGRGYDDDVMARLVSLAEERVGRRPLLGGRIFVDVGANIGTTTVPALVRYGAAEAVAFEPVPETFSLLEANLALNGVGSRARAVRVAISDAPGSVTMEVSAASPGDSRVRAGVPPAASGVDLLGEGHWPTTVVRSARLDDMVAEMGIDLDRVGLVWIDTQGHEAQVLAGARSVLERGLPLVVEFWPYGLRRAGGIQRLQEILAGAYGSFIDARAGSPIARPTSTLSRLAERYPAPEDYTDLLVLP
jgi:FkbM family methyltransferase